MPNTNLNDNCDALTAEFRATFNILSFPYSAFQSLSDIMAHPWERFPKSIRTVAAKFLCCMISKGGYGIGAFMDSPYSQSVMHKLVCNAQPTPDFSLIPLASDRSTTPQCTLVGRQQFKDDLFAGSFNFNDGYVVAAP